MQRNCSQTLSSPLPSMTKTSSYFKELVNQSWKEISSPYQTWKCYLDSPSSSSYWQKWDPPTTRITTCSCKSSYTCNRKKPTGRKQNHLSTRKISSSNHPRDSDTPYATSTAFMQNPRGEINFITVHRQLETPQQVPQLHVWEGGVKGPFFWGGCFNKYNKIFINYLHSCNTDHPL